MRWSRRGPAGAGSDLRGVAPGRSTPVRSPASGPNPLDDPDFVSGLRPVPSGIGDAPVAWGAADLSGVSPDGDDVVVDLGAAARPVLVVFLSTNCDGCDLFWHGLREDPPADVDVSVVTRGPASVPAATVAALADGVLRRS